MKLIRPVVYTILFLILPTIGFGMFLCYFGAPVILAVVAMTGFSWVQKEMFERALKYEAISKYMRIEKRRGGLFLISKLKEEQ